MSEMTAQHLAAIEEHSAGFAAAARGNLDADVEHCPGWTVADLVWHVTEVHWFWGTIAAERLGAPPDESRRPQRGPDERLVDTFEAGAARLVDALRGADGAEHVWTWAPARQDVAFITRHQVQEAAVHHWDAEHAAGRSLALTAPLAVDAVEEFLTFSVSSDADPADPPRPPLEATFALHAADAGVSWTLTDGATPGTVRFERGTGAAGPAVSASASDLLLWLYGRVPIDGAPVPEEVLRRFRALCFTD
jgi:uncharacterized protein (TIGR03083 family)